MLAVSRSFEHPFHGEVLDGYEVVLPREVGRQPMEKVPPFALDTLVALRNETALLLPVVRAMFFSREVALFGFQSLAFVQGSRRLDWRTTASPTESGWPLNPRRLRWSHFVVPRYLNGLSIPHTPLSSQPVIG